MSKHTKDELELILLSMPEHSQKKINRLYLLMDYASFTDDDGNVGMYCIEDENLLELLVVYSNQKLDISMVDMTNKVMIGDSLKLYNSYYSVDESIEDELNMVVDKYYKENMTIDTVLNKISVKGIDNLNDTDINFLNEKSKATE